MRMKKNDSAGCHIKEVVKYMSFAENVQSAEGGSIFLAILSVLSYRMLFHSQRHLNFTTMLFCVACAYSSSQLTMLILGGGEEMNSTSKLENAIDSIWTSCLLGIKSIQIFVFTILEKTCFYIHDVGFRQTCYSWTEFFNPPISTNAEGGDDFTNFGKE